MSINIGDNLSYLGAKPLDGRLKYDTMSEMAGMADNVLYEGCLAYCVGTGKTYQWKSTNTVDPTTGKWREFTSGGGTAEDPIEYVSQLPTSGIEDKIYGLAITGQISRTIDLINPVSGQPTKQQAIDYFSQYFTVTDVDADNIEIGVPPDLVLSRQNWGSNDWVAGRDFNKLYYNVSLAELEAYMDSTSFASTGAWGATSYYYIHCTSAYFPTYKYYAGVESSQELNEIGAGGGSVDDVIDDVETLPTSDVQNIFYRTTQEQIVTRYTDTTIEAIMTAMTPYGFTQGETVTNYETHTGNIYSTLTYLNNARHVYDNFDKPLQIYMFQPQGQSYYKLGCISNGVDAFWNANDPVGFKLGDNGLYAGKSSNNSTNRVAMFDEMSKTFRGTRTQWNALSTAEKKTYDGCALTDDYNAGGGGGNANIFTGTRADWESLTDEQKAVYDQVNLTDDLAGGEIVVVDEVANGNLNPVTSNAVFDAIHGLLSRDVSTRIDDLNSALTPGVHEISSSTINSPIAGMYGMVLIFGNHTDKPSATNQWVYQLAVSTDSSYTNSMWIRRAINSNSSAPTNWNDWKQIGNGGWTQVWSGSVSIPGSDGASQNLVTNLSLGKYNQVCLILGNSNGSRNPTCIVIDKVENYGCEFGSYHGSNYQYGVSWGFEVDFSNGIVRGTFLSYGWSFSNTIVKVLAR